MSIKWRRGAAKPSEKFEPGAAGNTEASLSGEGWFAARSNAAGSRERPRGSSGCIRVSPAIERNDNNGGFL